VYRELAEAYGKPVQLIEVGDRQDHLAKLATASAAGKLPDAFLINHRYLRAFADRGVLVAPQIDAADYYRIALDAFTVDGQLQCVPQNVSSLVVYVNTRKVDRVPLRWTFAELLATARRAQGEDDYAIAMEPNTIRMAPFVWGAGGELVDRGDDATRFTLGDPAARRGLETLAQLVRSGLAPDRTENEAVPPDERFARGELALYLSSRRDVPVFRAASDLEFDVAPFPVIAEPAAVLHSDGLCVADGPRADEAAAFVEFALGPEGQEILARGGRTVPSLKAVAESPAFLEGDEPRSNRVFLDAIDVMRRLPNTPSWTRTEESVDLAVEGLYYGELSIDEAIERIERETAGGL
jgi:multiple sugar transport system substrate-binding protein